MKGVGGGIGIIYKENLDLTATSSTFTTKNFEHCIATLKNSIQFVVIYRPPPSTVNGLKTSEFLDDFEVFLDELSIGPRNVLMGDYNIHVDEPHKSETKRFNDILASNGYCQLINEPTHKKGHTLDLLIINENDPIIHKHQVLPPFYSDHRFITCSVNHVKPPRVKMVISSRQFGKMKPEQFTDLLRERMSDFPYDSEDPNILSDAYESITKSVLDKVCPITTRKRIIRPRLPWYNDDIHLSRRIRRRLENKWRKSRSEKDHEEWIVQRNRVIKLITDSKIEYFSKKFSESNAKDMYATINVLLNKSPKVLPALDCSDQALANDFLSFFIKKVEKIRANVSVSGPTIFEDDEGTCTNNVNMAAFSSLTESEVSKIITRFPSKTCYLDTLPTWLVKDNLPILLPIFTRVVNSSLMSGVFPNTLKQSIITPVIKKSNLDNNILKNYRPVANMKFMSKVIEKAASCQVTTHVDNNNMGEVYQSSYKRSHSTETALLKVKNDINQHVDHGKVVFLVLLDMSAAFDTVDHSILLRRLKFYFGIDGSVLSWYKSYFDQRNVRVAIKNDMSSEHKLTYSLPQGSIIGPQGFIMYTIPIGKIIRRYNICFHCYADDIQLYAEFDPKIPGDRERVLNNLSACISEITSWMCHNKLQLNQDKTEFFIIATNRALTKLPDIVLNVGNLTIKPSASVRNLGVVFDGTLNMSTHVSKLCKTLNFHIRNLWQIRRFLSLEACHHAVRALVLSRIDYANSLLYGAREADLKRLQRIQNKAARLVFACGRDRCSVKLLSSLHWLPLKQRIHFKIMLQVYKCIEGTAPAYLLNLVTLYNHPDTTRSRHRLRSSSDITKLNPVRSHKRAGDCCFTVFGPQLWNKLPVYVREAKSVSTFKSLLKTYLFPNV